MLLVGHGFSLDYLLDIDLISFDCIVSSYTRISASDKIESAWTGMLSAQGGHKEMKAWIKPWEASARGPSGYNGQSSDDMDKIRKELGGGF